MLDKFWVSTLPILIQETRLQLWYALRVSEDRCEAFQLLSSNLNGYLELKDEESLCCCWSVAQWCVTLCNPMDCSTPGFLVHHQLLEPTQTHVHHISDAIQSSHPLLSPSPPALNLSQHQSLFKWVSSLHQVAKVLKFQLQHQSFQWIFRSDFL